MNLLRKMDLFERDKLLGKRKGVNSREKGNDDPFNKDFSSWRRLEETTLGQFLKIVTLWVWNLLFCMLHNAIMILHHFLEMLKTYI